MQEELLGHGAYNANATVEHCYNSGNISTLSDNCYSGGISSAAKDNIANSHNTGNITALNSSYAGEITAQGTCRHRLHISNKGS